VVVAVLVATAGLAMAACGSSANPGGTPAPSTTAADGIGPSCSLAAGAPSLTLSDTSPAPTVTVPVGTRVAVLVPPFSDQSGTPLHRGDPSVVDEVCSVTLPDHGTRTILLAKSPGRSSLSSAAAAGSGDTMVPAWLGTVVVTAGS
jgi:hypothetical protein